MKLSYVIVTANRCERLLATLEHLQRTTPLPRDQWEAWVVDNGSTDDTPDAVATQHPWAHLIVLPRNIGMAARNLAMQRANGDVITLLDDDSYPTGDAMCRIIDHFDQRPQTGAVVARVELPDGRCEASALPGVMIGCASSLRRSLINQIGGFDPAFFIQAEEYDLSFRIWATGFTVDRMDDVTFKHDKVLTGRSKVRTVFRDLRNNLLLTERFLPRELRAEYQRDWVQRYTAIARTNGHMSAAHRARLQAWWWARKEQLRGRQVLEPGVIETVFEHERQRLAVRRWAQENNINRIILADLGKNIFATWRACCDAELDICAIANQSPAFAGLAYRNIQLLPDELALSSKPDGIVISNVNPAQVGPRREQLAAQFDGPILSLYQPATTQPTITEPASTTEAA